MLHSNKLGIKDAVRCGRAAGLKVNHIFTKWDHLNGIAEFSGLTLDELMTRNNIQLDDPPTEHGTVITVYDPVWKPLCHQSIFTPLSHKRRDILVENIRVARVHGFRASLLIEFGDYLENIAEIVGISVPTLRMINGMNDTDGLVADSFLIVCTEAVVLKTPNSVKADPAPTPTAFERCMTGNMYEKDVHKILDGVNKARNLGQMFSRVVQIGDDIEGLASAALVSVSALRKINGMKNTHKIAVGDSILLFNPAPEKLVMFAPNVIQIRNNVRLAREIGCEISRVVEIGDTIEGLASAALVAVSSLRKMNGMNDSHDIKVGDLILLYAPQFAAAVVEAPAPTYTKMTPEATRAMRGNIIEDSSDGVRCWYKVRKGNCVEAIAEAAEMSVPELKSLNPTYNFDNVFVGSFLIVYCPDAPVPAPVPAPVGKVFLNLTPEAMDMMQKNIIAARKDGFFCWHKVRNRDCIEAIAFAAGVSVDTLRRMNPNYNFDFDNLTIGSYLIVFFPNPVVVVKKAPAEDWHPENIILDVVVDHVGFSAALAAQVNAVEDDIDALAAAVAAQVNAVAEVIEATAAVDDIAEAIDALTAAVAAQVCGDTNSVIGGGSYTFPATDTDDALTNETIDGLFLGKRTYADLCILEKSLKAHIKDLKVTLKEVKRARWDASEAGLHTSEFKIVSWA